MGLIDVIKGVSMKAVLGLVLASGASGCAQWQYDSTEFRDTGGIKTQEREVGRKIKTYLRYDISRDYKIKDSFISIPVKESKSEQDYVLTEAEEFAVQEEFIFEKKEEGGISGFLSAILVAPRFDYRKTRTGRTQLRPTGKKTIIENDRGLRRLVYEEESAKSLSVHVNPSEKELVQDGVYFTDHSGELRVEVRPAHNKMLSKLLLENMIRDELGKALKPEFAKRLEPSFLNLIEAKRFNLRISTSEISTKEAHFTNDEESILIPFYEISESGFDKILKRFVEEEINSKIGTVRLSVADIDSHEDLSNVSYILDVTSPSKEELARRYFIDEDGIDDISRLINDYARGEIEERASSSSKTFKVYVPSLVALEVRKTGYNFFKGEFEAKNPNTRKVILLSELGKKIRNVEVDETNGAMRDE